MHKRLLNVFSAIALTAISTTSWSDQSADEVKELIDQHLEEKWQDYTNSEAFENRVEQVILQFIEKQSQRQARQQQEARDALTGNIAPVDPASDYIKGQKNAEFSLVEYSDYECPFCKRFHKTANEFIKKYDQVNWVYRHFPLDFHNPGAQKQSEAAECAGELGGNDMFWAYSDKIYERTRSNGKGFPISNLVPLAEELGLNATEFEACFNSEKYKQKVLDQYANGGQSGVTGTPGNFLLHNASGTAIAVHGAQPLASLERAFDELLKRLPK